MENPGFCFRGADKENYDLNPSLLRYPYPETAKELSKLENNLWVEFRLRSKPLLGCHIVSGWEGLLVMQQYGFPTRLLDWSRSLAVAAYFAVREVDEKSNGAVWIMATRHLMEARGSLGTTQTAIGDPSINVLALREDDNNLEEFMNQIPVPIKPDQFEMRMVVQRGMYTIHSFKKDALEQLAKKDHEENGLGAFLHKIIIPACSKEGFRSELSLVAGVSEETIFPDIEGFARDFVSEHKRRKLR